MRNFISFFLSLCIFLSCFVLSVQAVFEKNLEFDTVIIGTVDDDIDSDCFSGTENEYFYRDNGVVNSLDHTCYSLLDAAQKVMYDAVLAAAPGTLNIKITFANGVYPAEDYTSQHLTLVMNAICRDHPELFYYNGFSTNGGAYYSGSKYINYINYVISLKSTSTYTASNIAGYYNALQNAVKSVPVDTTNRYNFVKSLHDYLCNNIYYPDTSTSDYVGNAHDAYGALVEGRAVCQGYAEAFKVICNYYNIPCVCISGTANGGGHMWNGVKMDDGKWYLLDATWDDQSRIYYDFFLSGLDTVCSYAFGSTAFSASHVPGTDNYLPVLNYSSDLYSQTNHATGFLATYNSYADTDNKCLYLSAFDSESNIYYDGIYVDVKNRQTGVAFEVGASSEDWTLIMLGDCNGDGEADNNDYTALVNRVVKGGGTADNYGKACDMNLDGYIDVIDATFMQRAVSGFDTDIVL